MYFSNYSMFWMFLSFLFSLYFHTTDAIRRMEWRMQLLPKCQSPWISTEIPCPESVFYLQDPSKTWLNIHNHINQEKSFLLSMVKEHHSTIVTQNPMPLEMRKLEVRQSLYFCHMIYQYLLWFDLSFYVRHVYFCWRLSFYDIPF